MLDPTKYSPPLEPTIPASPYINPYETTSQQYEIPPPPIPPKGKRSILAIVLAVAMSLLIAAVSIFALVLYKTNRYVGITTALPTSQPTIGIPTLTPTSTHVSTLPYTAHDIFIDFVQDGVATADEELPSGLIHWSCCSYIPEGGDIGIIAGSQRDLPMTLATFRSGYEASIDAGQIASQTQTDGPASVVYSTGNCLLNFSQYMPSSILQSFENDMLKHCT